MSWRTGQRPQLPRELFWKSFNDPFNQLHFEAPVVRASSISPLARDPDLRSTFRGANPLHYGVVVAPSGLACEEAVLGRSPRLLLRDPASLPVFLSELAVQQQHALAEGLDLYERFNCERSLELVRESYELALLCSPQLKLARHEQAGLALRASWSVRELIEHGRSDEALQRRYAQLRAIALARYTDSYEHEDISALKLGYPGCAYLIGELHRERGEYEQAFRWLARVAQDRGTPNELQRLARARLELCQEQRRSGAPAEIPPLDSDGSGPPGPARPAVQPEHPASGAGRDKGSSMPAGIRPVELVLTPTAFGREGAISMGVTTDALEALPQELPEAVATRPFTVSFSIPPPLSSDTVRLAQGQLEWLEAWSRVRGLDASAVLRAFIAALQNSPFSPGELQESELELILRFCLPDSRV